MQAGNDAKDSADICCQTLSYGVAFTEMKQSDKASKQWKKTHEFVNEMDSQHASKTLSLVRNVSDSNEQHDTEIASARAASEDDVAKTSEDIISHINVQVCRNKSKDLYLEFWRLLKLIIETIEVFQEDHSLQSSSIRQKALNTFQKKYMDYEPTESTPGRRETDIPTKGTIESLRAMPMDI